MPGQDFEVGARLELKNLLSFKSGARSAAESVDDIGEKARRSSLSLKAMGALGRGAGRALWGGIKYGAIGAGIAIAGIGVAGIRGHADVQRIAAQTEAVIESTGGAANVTAGHVEFLGDKIQALAGTDAELTKESANLLLTFKNIRNVGEGTDAIFDRATMSVANMSIALGQDMKSSALMLGKALNDPIKGVGRLARAGVDFTEQQKEQITALVESGNLLKAQKIILGELATEFGGSAKAFGETAAGQFERLKNTAGDALESIGARLLPIGEKVMPVLSKTIVGALDAVAPAIEKIAKGLGRVLPGLFESLAPLITSFADVFVTLAEALAPIVRQLAPLLAKVLQAIMPVLEPLLDAFAQAARILLRELGPVLPDLAKSFVRILVALAPLLPPLAKLIALFLKLAAPVIDAVSKAIVWVIEHVFVPFVDALVWLGERFGGIWDGIKGAAIRVKDAFVRVWDTIKNAFKTAVEFILEWVDRLLGPLDEIIGKLIDVIGMIGSVATSGVGNQLVPPGGLPDQTRPPAGGGGPPPGGSPPPGGPGQQGRVLVPVLAGPPATGVGGEPFEFGRPLTVNVTIVDSPDARRTAREVVREIQTKLARS